MSKLTAANLEQMSVEELLNLTSEDIPEMSFNLAPIGMYSGLLIGFSIPSPAENIDFFESAIQPTACLELAEDTPENQATAAEMINNGEVIKTRFYRKGGVGVKIMNSTFAEVIRSQIGNEQIGNFFALFGEEGFSIPVNFIVDHRAGKAKAGAAPDAPAPMYLDIKSVTPA